jgi:predicted ArsR family transcriptional regulator
MHKQKNETRTRVYMTFYRHWKDFGYAPTYDEVGAIVGISNVAVYRHVVNLIDDGFLEFNPNAGWRAVRIVKQGVK